MVAPNHKISMWIPLRHAPLHHANGWRSGYFEW